MKYVFNVELLANLHIILGVKQIDVCAAYDGDPATYIYRINHGTFPLSDLVEVSNAFHICMYWFIMPEDKLKMPKSREELVYDKDWQRVENNFGDFGVQFAKAKCITYKKAAEICRVSMSGYYGMFVNGEERWKKITVNNCIRMFNNSEIYPGEYLVDNNRPIIMAEGFHVLGIEGGGQMMQEHYFKQAMKINSQLSMQIAEMKEQMAMMEEEIRRLRGIGYIDRVAEDDMA